MNSRYNNNNVESQAVTNHNTIDLENNQGKEVNIFLIFKSDISLILKKAALKFKTRRILYLIKLN